MKLKRIISALIVFTMVMTCAVCVSADGATYQTSTKYDVSTGEITVNAKLKGAAEGSMVSYIIYGDDDAETNEAVAEGNIVHIDQATVGADGAASFDAVTADFDAFKNRKVQFVSNTEALTAGVEGKVVQSSTKVPVGTNLARSVETITDMQTSVMFVGGQINAKDPTIYAMIDGVPTYIGGFSGNIGTGTNWGSDDGVVPNYLPSKGRYATVDLKGTTAIMVDLGTKGNRDTYNVVKFTKYGGSYNGAVSVVKEEVAKNVASAAVYKTSSADTVKTQDEGNVNMLVGGLYKDDITDGKFAGLQLDGGDIIGVDYTNAPGNTNSNASYKKNANTVSYGTVYEPIIGKYTNDNGEFDSVTFLSTVTASAAAAYDEFGLNIYRYEKAATSAEEKANLELIASLPSVDKKTTFGIQLFDGANLGELDSTKYGFEAFPYVVIDGEKIELSVFGDTYVSNPTGKDADGNVTNFGTAYYYVRNREAMTEVE